MRSAIAMLAVAAATLAAPAAIKPAFSLMLHGSWLTGSVGSDGSRQCMAMAIGEIEGESFIATVAALGVIEFRFTSDRLTLSESQAVSAELLVDGRTIELAKATPVTPQAVQLVGAVEGRLEGSILRAIERGERAVVQLAGIRGTFSLGGSQQSIQLLSQCAMNGGRMPDTDALAFNSAPPEPSPAEVEAYADYVGEIVGDWNVYPSAPHIEGGCFATRMNDEGSTFLLHQERPPASVSFGVGAEWFNLSDGLKGQTALVVDGQSFPFLSIRALDKATLFSTEAGDPVALVNALRRGQTAEFSYQGKTYTFDLDGFAAMVPALAKCVAANDKTYASVQSVNLENRALGVTLPSTRSGSGPAAAVAEATTTTSGDSNSPRGLGNAMRGISAAGTPVVQFQCELTGRDLLGVPNIIGRDQPAEALININADGSALINGTTIQPYDRIDEGGALATAAYPAREVVAAIQGAPMERAPVLGLSDEQKEAFAAFQTIGRGMVDQAMDGRPRYMIVSVASSVVGFVDLDASGNAINQTSPYCQRTR